jgi:FixJ family two-component response regulator
MFRRIDVIDSDVSRRAKVFRELSARGCHVEIYDDAEEYLSVETVGHLIFIADEADTPVPATLEALRNSTKVIPSVVAYSENPDTEMVVAGMRVSILDYLAWPFDRRLIDGVFLRLSNCGDRARRLEDFRSRARAKVRGLTGRETDVLTHLVRGRSNREIGQVLGISSRTVEIHRSNMLSRLGAHSISDAIRIGVYAELDVEAENQVGPLLAVA